MKAITFSLLLFLIGCTAQKSIVDASKLNAMQVKGQTPGITNAPGKCYQRMMNLDGTRDWYEIICPGQHKEYALARACLEKLGYELIADSGFKTLEGNGLIDFQKKNQMAFGALDQASLKRLIEESGKIE